MPPFSFSSKRDIIFIFLGYLFLFSLPLSRKMISKQWLQNNCFLTLVMEFYGSTTMELLL